MFDFTSFAKIEVRGGGAAAFLERLCDNQVARGVGRLTYTQMLNDDGGIECDFTVTRLGRATAFGSSRAPRSAGTTCPGSGARAATTARSRSRT